ncbi:uncharacterized protein [Primulina eburnea]|uniref:uncharacterized protein n=1 Tax=Primulina eburnea TaxID=1245227 RepID=UPI003C6BDCD4
MIFWPQTSFRADGKVNGFDLELEQIACIPFLALSLLGWKFVGSDVTDVAIECAKRNVRNNPHTSELIEIIRVECEDDNFEKQNSSECDLDSHDKKTIEIGPAPLSVAKVSLGKKKDYYGPPVLLGVVKDRENFDFCMCNPPFFEMMKEAGLNPNTACGGTSEEMVCFGGVRAFMSHIIGDSVQLKHKFRARHQVGGLLGLFYVLQEQRYHLGGLRKITSLSCWRSCILFKRRAFNVSIAPFNVFAVHRILSILQWSHV